MSDYCSIMRFRRGEYCEYSTNAILCPDHLLVYLNEYQLIKHQAGRKYVRHSWKFESDSDELKFLLLYSEAVFDA